VFDIVDWVCVPAVDLFPDHPPVAVQLAALFEDHVKTGAVEEFAELGEAEILHVGG
jgi:hypothetical protein